MLDITVTIPYYNESKTILATLEMISAQEKMPAQVFLVNSSSTDKTSEIIDKWILENQSRYETRFSNLFEGTNNPASSKNVGIKNATTTWIAFMDCGLKFPSNWLKQQWDFVQSNALDVVSGVCLLKGVGIIDTAAVSQTYGFDRKRPCVPSTLVKRSVFEQTGLFLENRRAGYDYAWPLKLKEKGIERGINEGIVVRYNGVNFGSRISFLLKKSFVYSIPTVKMDHYYVPYYYLIILFLMIPIAIFLPSIFIYLFVFYLIFRGYIIPIYKSRSTKMISKYVSLIFWLPLIGIVLDVGRTLGIIVGFYRYHLKAHQ